MCVCVTAALHCQIISFRFILSPSTFQSFILRPLASRCPCVYVFDRPSENVLCVFQSGVSSSGFIAAFIIHTCSGVLEACFTTAPLSSSWHLQDTCPPLYSLVSLHLDDTSLLFPHPSFSLPTPFRIFNFFCLLMLLTPLSYFTLHLSVKSAEFLLAFLSGETTANAKC